VAAFFAAGRDNLIGEHTDYAGGLVLPYALPLGITLDVEPADELDLDVDPRYVEAVAAELGVAPGIRGTLRSDLPIGAGLASSAALEVALARALCAFNDLEISDWELIHATRRAEERAVGVPCGVMDQAAAVLARDRHAILIDTATFAHRYVELPDVDIVVLDSGVRRRLEDSRYAERRAEVERGDPRRLRHVASENERVRATVDALERGDLDALGPIFRASHDSLRDDFEVSTPELDALVDAAYAAGAIAARMTGAGFGGCVVALTRRGERLQVSGAL
jgi:galactokinase